MAPRPTILTLSRSRRRHYFQLLLGVFILVAPLLFLYATGYRFERVAGLTETGGIYVGAEQSGALISLNNELVHETGTFRHAFYVEGLDPGTYTILVSKPDYHSWGKTLDVSAQRVTEAQAFNMPLAPMLELIPQTFINQTTNATTTATSTPALPNPVYAEIKKAFATTTTSTASKPTVDTVKNPPARPVAPGTITPLAIPALPEVATSTKAFRGMQLYDEGPQIVARWTRGSETLPVYFCVRKVEAVCIREIALNTKGEKASYFDFFPGTTDLALVTLSDGVYVTELDNRSGQNIQPLYLTPGADFRVIDGVIYVKTNASIYKVEI